MTASYQIVEKESKHSSRELAAFLAREGQLLLPFVDLVETAQTAIDDLVDVMGRATIEAILRMSAEGVAGPRQQGKKSDRHVYWHGTQPGRVALSDRQLRVEKPRLRKRKKQAGERAEVEIPAYEALQKDERLADRMLSILLHGVSTRSYEKVLPEMAETVGVSKSQVSRENIEAGERLLKELAERDFSDKALLVIYLDGIQFGEHHVLVAVGVDTAGYKHVLGLREGASENSQIATSLLEELVARGVKPGRRRLFVIDGSKALRKAIDQVYGAGNPVQRCRNHKRRNVLSHLPKEQHDQCRATLAAAWKLAAQEGIEKIEQYAAWLERDWPSAAASLREGLEEMFTINRLGLPGSLRRCLGTTNLLDSTHSGMRQRTRRVTNWQNGAMAVRWAAASLAETEKNYRRIMGHEQLWMLKAHLDDENPAAQLAHQRHVG
jgi:transposase-like protein